jgi:uncharacterized membrane protein YqaE (UPF0057 family)
MAGIVTVQVRSILIPPSALLVQRGHGCWSLFEHQAVMI